MSEGIRQIPWEEMRRLARRVSRMVKDIRVEQRRILFRSIEVERVSCGRVKRGHLHTFYEAHLILEGTGVYTNACGEHLVQPGSALLHPPYSPHGWETRDHPLTRLVLSFTVEPIVPFTLPAQAPHWPELVADFRLLLADVADGADGWRFRASARAGILVSRLLAISAPQPLSDEVDSEWSLIALIDQYLRDNLDKALSLNDVAAMVGMSTRSLTRRYRELTGNCIMDRLRVLRLDRAATLLIETDASLAAIGERVGMPDPSYLCRRFSKQYKMTPRQYQHAMQAIHGHSEHIR